MREEHSPVLVTGATGFVGRHLLAKLTDAGFEVRCASRRPPADQGVDASMRWVRMDVDRPETIAPALQGVRSVVYLIHGMGAAGDYEQRERASAKRFAEEADRAGVRRIVYLGGIAPMGEPSKHLRSRLATGEIFRRGSVPTVELRAGMIVGAGSESWRIVRDLSLRLPAMVLPKWLRTRSQPIAIDDVVTAITYALELPGDRVGCYDLPGPETMTAREILFRIAKLRGMRLVALDIPVLSPRLSSYWLKLVTRADFRVAQELVLGLTSDLIAADDGFWMMFPEHSRVAFDDAARAALQDEDATLPWKSRLYEGMVRGLRATSVPSGPKESG